MKLSVLFSLVALARQASSSVSPTPLLQWDPDTAKDCVEWYNNGDGESCEYVRKLFGITPEQFTKWNPSVGLDCKPWDWQSYCIVTQERLDNTPPPPMTTSSSTTTATSTTSSSTLGPSPTAWVDRGCYVEDPSLPILEQNMSPAGGDASLTIPKCKDSCYRRAYEFAGVQEGNQCWCGTYVGGEWARNQTDCNIPCTGDNKTFCGGKGLLSIFQAQENQEEPVYSIGTSTSTGSNPDTVVTTVSETRSSSGAMRNMAWF
ncbi:hypothetical protein C8A01DRAFT_38277 [Parachaetomium inaequale]|uniref:WSC domain-containing protein n=1 Tax=Parachaetomium inaequale TaxID=2588326 RepID=A0AAN6PD76_9PEZI|nr:hypothetical protein C8A01DRAFT_38277 [Parachaetomium inaequale]